MRYFTLHHGSYWFQLRVPARLRSVYGQVVRINLQVADAAAAKQLSVRLAADWFSRFSANLAGEGPFEPPPAATPGNHAPVVDAVASQLTMTAAFEYWRELTPDRPPRTVLEFGATAEKFDLRVAKPLPALTRVDVANFRDSLLKDGLSSATARKSLGFISAMIQTQVDAGRLPVNIARGLRVPRQSANASRQGFTADQLQAVFSTPIYTRGHRPRAAGGEAAAWLPILALATGARVEELAQLRVRDVELFRESRLLLNIRSERGQTRLKTASSERVVPVHTDVAAAGFTRYVQRQRSRGEEWLFPDLKRDALGSRSGQFSKWFGRWLRGVRGCGIDDPRVVFHSFRHTFKTLCRGAGLPEEIHDALTGHAGSVGRTYGAVPIETLVAAVDRIEFPVSIPAVTVPE